jgi:hypothetical protein
MTALRFVFAAAGLALLLTACSRESGPETYAGPGNALLDYVPADTPYLAANLDPLPEEVVDSYLQRLQPVLETMQAELSAARSELEAESAGSDPSTQLLLAVLQELDGKLSRAGLASLGLDIPAHRVVYGLGAFPVFRIGLEDPAVLRATLQRVLANAGIAAPEMDFQGRGYWRLPNNGEPIELYLSIREDHLALALLPPAAEAELLPNFLGLQMPQDGGAQDRLVALNAAEGYSTYGSGMVDLHRMADELLQPDRIAAQTLSVLGNWDPAALPPACVAEIHGILDNMPRLTAGVTELDEQAIAYRYRLETPATLATELLELVSRVPQADPLSLRLLEFAFGMRFGAARDFLRAKAEAITAEPYACEQLQDLNEAAANTLARLEQPMPPFVNNFRGVRVSLSRFTLEHSSLPADATGHLALHVEQPEMFVGMAQMFLPDLSELAIAAGDPPVRLPETLLPAGGLVAFAAMSADAIGLALGEGEEEALPGFLTRDAGPEGMLLSASYDTAAYLDYTSKLGSGDAQSPVHDIADAAREAFRAMADRSLLTVGFDPRGMVIDGRMSFREAPAQ